MKFLEKSNNVSELSAPFLKVKENFSKRWGSFWKYSLKTMSFPSFWWWSWRALQDDRSEACEKPGIV